MKWKAVFCTHSLLPFQVHIQTIGILVAEKTELQSSLGQAQKSVEQKQGKKKYNGLPQKKNVEREVKSWIEVKSKGAWWFDPWQRQTKDRKIFGSASHSVHKS